MAVAVAGVHDVVVAAAAAAAVAAVAPCSPFQLLIRLLVLLLLLLLLLLRRKGVVQSHVSQKRPSRAPLSEKFVRISLS